MRWIWVCIIAGLPACQQTLPACPTVSCLCPPYQVKSPALSKGQKQEIHRSLENVQQKLNEIRPPEESK